MKVDSAAVECPFCLGTIDGALFANYPNGNKGTIVNCQQCLRTVSLLFSQDGELIRFNEQICTEELPPIPGAIHIAGPGRWVPMLMISVDD